MRFIELAKRHCSIRGYKPDAVPEELLNEVLEAPGLPEGVVSVILLSLGFPNAPGREKTRKPLEELVRYEHW